MTPRYLVAALAVLATPALGQTMDHASHGQEMPGMSMPAEPASPKVDPHVGHDMTAMGQAAAGTDLPPGDAPPPVAQPDHLADRFWNPADMARSREMDLRRMHGGGTYYQILMNIAEAQIRRGRDGYRWDGEAWIGGDINRLTLKSEGEGDFSGEAQQAEVQALYSRALDPYWNLQAGIRHDIKPNPSRTYATIGIEGLAPYWFNVEAALFLSSRGDVLGRAEAWYDQRLTQFVVLQPRFEANLAAQNVPEDGIGGGLSDIELGLRLRYEKSRRIAPYVGVSWERQVGDTARYSRLRNANTGGFSFVIGLRALM